jgi:hypothetical protein
MRSLAASHRDGFGLKVLRGIHRTVCFVWAAGDETDSKGDERDTKPSSGCDLLVKVVFRNKSQ